MKQSYTWTHLCLLILTLFSLSQKSYGQEILSASISQESSNILVVSFSETIEVSNADGFRLVGGAARIASLKNDTGSTELSFTLTDHVLPEDNFRLLHWAELSDAESPMGKLPSFENVAVTNEVEKYNGNGKLYYVSSSNGSNTNDGLTPELAFASIFKALDIVQPGDYVLLKRGDQFETNVVVDFSGEAEAYITFAAYGSGEEPIIDYGSNATFVIQDADYIALSNLHLKNRKGGESGVAVRLEHNSDHIVVSNCVMTGYNGASFGVHLQRNGGTNPDLPTAFENPQILNNHISGFRTNIRASGYRYNDSYQVNGGLIENNTLRNSTDDDGANFQRGHFNDMIVRKNDVAEYDDDGIDTYGAHDIIIEYNTIHDPQPNSTRGKGIKAGGIIRDSENPAYVNVQSSGVIVRYNIVKDVSVAGSCACDGIVTNGGGSGEIYGNLVYNTKGHGMKVDGLPQDWKIYNNTVMNAEKTGLQFYVENGADGVVNVSNNIFGGSTGGLQFAKVENVEISGGNNIMIDRTPPSHANYLGAGDFESIASEVFQSVDNLDFNLKEQSPAINAGLPEFPSYTKDIRGVIITELPDIGAFESGELGPPVEYEVLHSSNKAGTVTVNTNYNQTELKIRSSEEIHNLVVMDTSGRVLYRSTFGNHGRVVNLPISTFRQGVYITAVGTDLGVHVNRFIK